MRKVILRTLASLDSFTALSHGNIDRLQPPEYTGQGEDCGYSEFLSNFDTTLMGHNTYKVVP